MSNKKQVEPVKESESPPTGCKCGGEWVLQMRTVYPGNGASYQVPGTIACTKCGTERKD